MQSSDFARKSILISVGIFVLFMVWVNTIADASELNWNGWAFYEWLINYESGFVRRGVAGALVNHYFYGEELFAVNWIVFLLSSVLVILATVFAMSKVTTVKSALLFAFCPAGLFGMAAGNEHYYRKEVLFYIAVFAISLVLSRWIVRPSRVIATALTVVIFCVSIFLLLIHEGFLFYGCFFFSLVLIVLHRDRPVEAKLIVSFYVLLSFLIVALLSFYKGDLNSSQVIWGSLSDAVKKGTQEPLGGIQAIGWTLRDTVNLTLSLITGGLAPYYLFSIILIYLTLGYIVSEQRSESLKKIYLSKNFFFPFFLVFLSFFPLFILGWDWGRWIVGMWFVLVCIFFLKIDIMINQLTTRFSTISPRTLSFLFFGALFGVNILTRVPECCIGGSGAHVLSSSLHFWVKLISKTLLTN